LIHKPRYINAGGRLLDLGIPAVMGILNVTSDSFYKGSRYNSDSEIIDAATGMLKDGASIIDIGGYSSRPGAADIPMEEEMARVRNAVVLISGQFPEAIISVDTFRSRVAKEAVLEWGAHIINDISGGEADTEMFRVVKELNVPYILMHMRGTPRTMLENLDYDDVVADILGWFGEKIFRLRSEGVKDIIIDPGFGFSKNTEQNFEMLRRISDFSIAGLPLMVGISRKTMIWKTLGITAGEALNGTTALNTIALLNGADILRVHDVKEAVQAVHLVQKLREVPLNDID
jgi:dihydropteroate synthase